MQYIQRFVMSRQNPGNLLAVTWLLLRDSLIVKYTSHSTVQRVCVCVNMSVNAHLITGFHGSHRQTVWSIANPHKTAHIGASLLYHYITSGWAAPSLALCWSLQLSLYRRVCSSRGEGGTGARETKTQTRSR